MLAASDMKDKIGLWDYKELEKLNKFSNENPKGNSDIGCSRCLLVYITF